MENNNHNQNHNEEVRISKKTLYTVGAILGALLILAGIYFAFFNNKKDKTTVQTNNNVKVQDSIINGEKDSMLVLKDSANLVNHSETPDYEGEEGPYYPEYRVISKTLPAGNLKLNYGDKVFVDDAKSTPSTKIIYLQNPLTVKNTPAYSVNGNNLIDDYQFTEYKKYFSLPPFSELMPAVKKLILDNDYSDGTQYEVTQNAERAKSSLSYGDYDGDGMTDAAVILDNVEKQSSHLLIICTNNATKLPYVAFEENYSDKMRINNFRKGSQVFMNTESLVSSPQDGVIAQAEDVKIAVIYDRSLQKFKTYSQEGSYSEE